MNKLTNPMSRFAAVVSLCCVIYVVLSLSAFTLPSRHTSSSQFLSQSLTYSHSARPERHVSPLSMYMTSSPLSQTVRVDQQANSTFSWGGGGLGTTVFIVDWRDGNSDSYRCGFNCYSGSFTYGHVYTRTGTFVVKAYLDSNPSVNTYSTVYVIS